MHFRRIISAACVALGVAAAFHFGTGQLKPAQAVTDKKTVIGSNKETLYFWYTDDSMTSYINSAAVTFGEERGVRVIPVLASAGEYLEAINEASLHSEQIPDVYLIDSSALEKAYLAGLACVTADEGGVCNRETFPASALNAVSYHGKNIAYPLYFQTSALLYNETYLTQWAEQQEDPALVEEYLQDGVPGDLDALLHIADSFDVPENVEGVMKWDVSDIFYNYWIVGRYLVVGGDAGDDEGNIDIYNEKTVECLKTYQALNQFFSMETKTVSSDSILRDFIDGKIMFTIATTDAISRLERAKEDGSFAYEYGIATMPDVSEDLESASLSVTGCVAVNGYSVHKKLANDFAIYLVDECAENLYEKTGKPAARLDADADNGDVQIFKAEYADSVSLPKMMGTGNFWLQMEVVFSKVWNGADVDALVSELAEQIAAQVSAQ